MSTKRFNWCPNCGSHHVVETKKGNYRCRNCSSSLKKDGVSKTVCFFCGEEERFISRKRGKFVTCQCQGCGRFFIPGYKKHKMAKLKSPFGRRLFKAIHLHNVNQKQLCADLEMTESGLRNVFLGNGKIIPREKWGILCQMPHLNKKSIELEFWEKAAILTETHNLVLEIFDEEKLLALGWIMQISKESREIDLRKLEGVVPPTKDFIDLVYLDDLSTIGRTKGFFSKKKLQTPFRSFLNSKLPDSSGELSLLSGLVGRQFDLSPRNVQIMLRSASSGNKRSIPYKWLRPLSEYLDFDLAEAQARLLVSKLFDPFELLDKPHLSSLFQRLVMIARMETYIEEEWIPEGAWERIVETLSI